MKHLESINALPSQYPDFRTVLWTGESSQLVVMTVPVGGDIGEEVSGPHCYATQTHTDARFTESIST